ncbi:MAG TPA: hypothetical protein VGH90_08220 [Chthoniobacteraceae bacterium]|jgi:hypothetical protein
MDALAKAVVISLHFLDTVEDDLLDPDLAIKIMESIVDVLSHCSAEEKEALRRSVNALADVSRWSSGHFEPLRPDARFYSEFMDSMFPNDEPDKADHG